MSVDCIRQDVLWVVKSDWAASSEHFKIPKRQGESLLPRSMFYRFSTQKTLFLFGTCAYRYYLYLFQRPDRESPALTTRFWFGWTDPPQVERQHWTLWCLQSWSFPPYEVTHETLFPIYLTIISTYLLADIYNKYWIPLGNLCETPATVSSVFLTATSCFNERPHDFLNFNRVIEMPYAYQCCVYGSCASYKSAGQWEAEHRSIDEDLHKRTVAIYPIHADAHCKKRKRRLLQNKGKWVQTWAQYSSPLC